MVAPDPLSEITADRDRARLAGDRLVDVCYLGTVGPDGHAEMRAISLREIIHNGFELLISRTSPKWAQLSRYGVASLLIHWPAVSRQVRASGPVMPLDRHRVEHYWSLKGYASRLLEAYYEAVHPQSHVVRSHAEFLAGIDQLKARYPNRDAVPVPQSLVGLLLVPEEIEIWHGSPDRLHERRRFRRSLSDWSVEHLVP